MRHLFVGAGIALVAVGVGLDSFTPQWWAFIVGANVIVGALMEFGGK